MQQLATLIRKQLDTLVDQYDARLRGMPGYSNFPEAMRRDLERHFLNLIVESLEAGDYSGLVQYAQQRASDWAARGLNLAWFQQALIIPEDLLVPLVQSVETGNFVWQALNRSQSAVWQMVTDRAHQTEERFRSIVETSHSGVLITDDAFHLTYVNDELVQISGYTREELLNTDFRQLFDEESRRIVLDHYVRRQQGEAVAPRYEVAFLRKDGTKRYIEMSAVSLKDVTGKSYTVAQVLDVSERKQTEQALRTSESQYQTIFDSTPIMFWLKDTHNRTLRVNKAAALFEGVQPADVEGKSCYDVYPAEQAEAFYQDDMQVIRSGQPKLGIIEQHTSVGTGKLMWVETGKVPIRDEHGAIVGVLAFAVDITARRETEAALAQERNLLRTLIDTLPDQVFVKDTEGRLILYNQADAKAMRLTSTEEALGKTVYDSYPRELADAYFADDMAVIESGQSLIDREELGQTEDGQERWVLTTKVPLKDQAGRSLGLVGIARDITQRKQIEATLQESEERFRRFSDATTEGLVFHDKGVILDANPAIVALFGFTTADELIGHNLLEFIVPDSHPLVLQKMQLDDVHPYEIQCRRNDGTTFPAETSTRAYPYGNRIIRASAVRDITARKHLEQELTAAQRQFQNIIEFLPDATFVIDRDKRVIAWNRAIEVMSGMAKEDILGKGDYEYALPFYGERRPLIIDLIGTPDEEIEAKYDFVQKQGDTLYAETFVATMFGGRGAQVGVTASPLRDEAGNYAGAIESIRDITDRKQAEVALQQTLEQQQLQSRRLQAVLEATDELIRITDLDLLYRRAVELAREKLNIERCGMWLIDPARQYLLGTYGTDNQGRTTDERTAKEPIEAHSPVNLFEDKLWFVYETQRAYWKDSKEVEAGTGWVVGTSLRGAKGPIGIFYNDAAISGAPLDEAVQNQFALYGSMVGNIIENKWLEQSIRESLIRRNIQVQTSVEVAQHIAAAPEIGELFHRVVTLVKERFNYYHAQLFRYVPAEDAVVLITGYGEIGQRMLEAGHKLAMGRGVVGTAAATGQSILAADVARDLDWRPNPNLPATKGELAVPIKLGSGDAEAQVHALEHFTTGSYAGIAVAAIDPEAIARITHKSLQNGKPVVAISIDLGQEHQTAALISVEHTVGYLLGVEAGTWAKQHLLNAQPVKIGVLTCRTLPNVVERERGIIDGIHSVIGERATVVVNADAFEAKEAAYLAEGWLHNHPDLNMIVAYNDATALGAYQAAQNAGWRDPDQFFIGGIDAVPEALEAIQQGGVYQATVNQPPEVMGIMAVRTLIAAIKGVPVKPVSTLYCALVNRSNAAEFTGPSREATILANQEVIPAEALAGFDVSGLRLGLSVLTMANPFFATLAASAQKEAQRLGVQLVINDPSQVLGVLDVQSDQAGALTDDDRLLLEGLCGQIASAMESTRLLDQLRHNEAQLSEALKIANLAYWEYDVERDHFLFNDQFYSLFHTTAEQQGGYELSSAQYAQQFVHPDDLPIVGAEIERALKSTERHYSRDLVHRILYADGGVGYISVNINIDRDEQGKILRYYGANQDITERQLAEEAVRRSEAQLAEALKIAKLAYWEYDVEKDLFLFNDQFYALFHTTVDRVGGYQISSAQYAQQFVHPDDLPMVGGEIERALNSTDRHYSRLLEHRILYVDGGIGYISVNVNIDRDEQGKILRYYGANQDITERKLAEAKLEELLGNMQESEQLMRTVINSTSDWIFIKDQDHRYRLVNQGYADSLHISIEEFIGKNDLELGFPEDLVKGNPEMGIAGFWVDDRAVMDSGQTKIIPNDLVMIDGALRTYNTIKTPLRDSTGQVWGVLAFARDITDLQKAQEDLLARNTQLTAFNRLGQTLAQILTVEEIVERVFQTAGEIFDNRNFYIALYDQHKQEISFPLYTIDGERRAVASRPFGNGMTEYIVRTKRPLLIARDVQTFAASIGIDNIGRASRCYLGVPILSGDTSLGVMTVQDYEHENVYIQADVELLTAIATRMAAALENVRLYSIQAQRAVQLQTASEVSRAAASILNLDELLPQAVELIRTRFELSYVGIFLLDDAAQWAILRAGTGEAGHIMLANNHRLEIGGNSMISQCIVMQRARIALDVGEEAVRFDNPLLPLTRSEMALPLVSRGRTIGAMTIQSEEPAAFTADDITALQSMADQIGNAVENARLYAQTQAALAETDQLLQASAELNVSNSYNDVLDVIRKYTVLGQQALTIAVNVFDRPWTESQTPTWIEVIGYYTKRSSGVELGTRFPIAMFPSAKSLLRPDAPSIIENFDTAQADPNTYALFVQRFASKSVIFMPLVVGGQWFGYLNVLYSNPTQFDQVDVRRLMAMVGQAAVAVQNLRNLAASQQTLTETEASYRATQAIGRAETVEGILEATTHVVDLIGMTRAMLRVVSRRDVNNAVMATDIYTYHHVAGQWVLQPVAKDVPAGDATALRSLQRDPEAVVIYTDAQNPNSAMPDEVRQALLTDQLRSTILTSVNLQNEVLGFLSFGGPQALNETAEQRLRIAVRTLSDQVAVALQNRLLFEQTRVALQEVDAINRRLTGEAWENYLHQQAGREVIWLADDDVEAPEVLPQLDESLTAGQITLEPDPDDASEATVTAPILLRGQPIGALRLRTPLSEWDEDSEAMLADIAGHIAQAVENARLVEQTQRTAQRERTINEINARVRQSVDLDAILRTAVNELGQSLKAARVVARIGTTAAEGTAAAAAGTTTVEGPTAAGDGRGKTND